MTWLYASADDSPRDGPSGLQSGPSDVRTTSSVASDSDTPPQSPDDVSIPTSSPSLDETPQLQDIVRNFQGCYSRHSYTIPSHVNADPILFLNAYRDFFKGEIRQYFTNHSRNVPPTLKVFVQLSITLVKVSTLGENISRYIHITSRTRLITPQDVDDLVRRWIEQLRVRLESLTTEVESSGYIISSVNDFFFFCTYAAYSGIGSYVPYPCVVRGKHEIFNPSGIQSSCVIQCLAAFKLHKMGKSWSNIRRSPERPAGCSKWSRVMVWRLPWVGKAYLS